MKLDFQSWLSPKHAQKISWILIAFFGVLIIYQLSTLRLRPDGLETQAPAVGFPIAQNISYKELFNSSLFGAYVTELNENTVKKSLLNVTVVGILVAGSNSQVIIRAANGEERVYRLNDKIPGDAIIKKITVQGIVVERHGVLESLSLPKSELNFEPVAKPLEGD
ncbi:MAG: hypothetical protein BGO90_08360 [Legionella sp. 40-6]|nr:MAG: hypothetical protein BGO90_08360 [Legionella sp. 40-6]